MTAITFLALAIDVPEVNRRPVLSICIPTYNRPNELSAALRILADELKRLPSGTRSQIEVIISDNCSNLGDVRLLMQQYADELNDATLIVHEKNLGPTLNFEYCYTHSSGEYVLILSDDDHLAKDSIASIITSLLKENPDVIFLPFFPTSYTDERYTHLSRNDFIRRSSIYSTLVSSCILKRSLIDKSFGSYLDTNMHHIYYLLNALENGERFIFFEKQMIFCPHSCNSGGYDWFRAFVGDFFTIINEFPTRKIDRRVLEQLQRKMLIDRITPTFLNKVINGYTINENFVSTPKWKIVRQVSRHCKHFLAFWIYFLPIALTPTVILLMLKNLYVWQKPYLFKWH